jgi:hypothetical protein
MLRFLLTFHTILYSLLCLLSRCYWYMVQAAWELHSCIIRLQSVHHRPALVNHLGWKHTVSDPHMQANDHICGMQSKGPLAQDNREIPTDWSLYLRKIYTLPNPLSGKQLHFPCESTKGNCTLLGLTFALIAFLRKVDMADLYGGSCVEHKC